MLAPREHDLFAALCEPGTVRFLQAYGAEGLDLTHLEYARLARSLRDLAVRIRDEVDLEGVNTWGIDGVASSGCRPHARPTVLRPLRSMDPSIDRRGNHLELDAEW